MAHSRGASPHDHDHVLIILIHLIASSYFALLSVRFVVQQSTRSLTPLPDVIAVLLYFLGVLIFSSLSIIYRTVTLIDREHAVWAHRLEEFGVLVLIWASTIPFLYFQFYDSERPRWLYLWMITVTGVRSGTSLLSAQPESAPSWTGPFIPICVMFGALALLPAGHALLWESACRAPMISDFIKYTALNTVGGVVYLLRAPERWRLFRGWCVSTYAVQPVRRLCRRSLRGESRRGMRVGSRAFSS
jgi:predicted membrane channel-forming protein YqfA (hemolysin III family)